MKMLPNSLFSLPSLTCAYSQKDGHSSKMNVQSSLTFGLSAKSIRTCHVSHSVIQPVQNWRSGRGHLITAWFSSVVHFLLRVFPPLPLPAPLQHITPPTDQLIKNQWFLVIKAVGYPDKISPSFILSDSSAGCMRGEREGCLQKWGCVTFVCSQTNSSSRWQPEELMPIWGGKWRRNWESNLPHPSLPVTDWGKLDGDRQRMSHQPRPSLCSCDCQWNCIERGNVITQLIVCVPD